MLTRQRKTPAIPLLASLLCAAGLLGTHPAPAGASTAGGHTYYVSPSGSDTNPGTQAAPFATIGAALNADTLNYDTIILEDGVYTGPGNRDLSFGGRTGITVESLDGAGSVTIDCGGSASSDGSGDHRGFFLNNGEQYALIKGLTIENGYESSSAPSGLAGGAGVFVGSGDTVSVTGCVFLNNYAYGSGAGVFTYGSVNIQQCAFTGNSSNGGANGDGSALNVNSGGSATAVNCLFTSNAGTAVDNFNALTLYFCSFTQNGGGLLSFDPATLTDDIFYNDTGTEVYDGGSDLTATYCDIQGGYAGTGNKDADPLFVNPPADLHLQPGSPCIGAGTDVGYETDYDGHARPNPPSIGAYEGGTQAAFQVYVVNAQSPAGQTVLLSAALTKPGGVGLAGATLTFAVDGQTVGTGVTNKNGDASVHYAVPLSLSQGSHTITVSFAGDGANPASSGTGTLTVTAPRTTLVVGAASGMPGQTVTLSATLKSTASGAALSGETVTFSVDGTSAGMATTNANGVATLSYTIPAGEAAGSHAVTASFAGDGTYAASAGRGTLTVKNATSLSVANVSGARGTSVTLSATLTAGGAALPGKTVTFRADGRAVGTAVTNGSGVATLTYAIPAGDKVGAHALGASFAGDTADNAAVGAGTLTVS